MEKKPLYQMLMETLEKRIREGYWAPQEAISSESELEREFGVSNITVRRALTELERQGFITRVKGKGSFVCPIPAFSPGQVAKVVSLILPFERSLEISMQLLQGITEVLEQEGYSLQVSNSGGGGEQERRLLERHRESSAGLLVYPLDNTGNLDLLCAIAAEKRPLVLLDKNLGNLPFWSVESDNQGGAYAATEHLIRCGHRRIAFLSHISIDSASTVADRFLGYVTALHSHKIPVPAELTLVQEAGAAKTLPETLRFLLQQKATAVVCTYDALAAELIQAAVREHIPIPEALSVTGFDNLPYARHLSVPLTTVNQDMREMGCQAASLLLKLMKGICPEEPRRILIPATLIRRESVGKIET